MSTSGSNFEPVLLFGACIMVLHLMLHNLLIAVLIRFLRETNGLAMLTSAQKAWQTTQRLVKRSASIMDTGSSTAAALCHLRVRRCKHLARLNSISLRMLFIALHLIFGRHWALLHTWVLMCLVF